jgi:flagellin
MHISQTASRSRILDSDYAKEASDMARLRIIQEAATSVLAQANVNQRSVLDLLK